MVWYEANGFVDTDRERAWPRRSRNSGILSLWPRTRPQAKVWKAGKGQQEGWGLCWEQRTAPGHGGSAWREGQGKEELIKSALIQKHASKYWIKCKDTQSGRERPLPNKKQSPVLHVNTFLQDSQRQLVQVKNNKDWQVVQSSPLLTVRVSQN